jgi:hypothetical protein
MELEQREMVGSFVLVARLPLRVAAYLRALTEYHWPVQIDSLL